ncbi:MAG: FAD-dependent oxidoreductase [Elusimicrobia bacterium]|nr:FAD-dependent oxidoreductase [Candidatus Liberimonas magnetica]
MKRFIIIGNSAAGVAAAEEIRKIDNSSEIVIVSDEKGNAYSKCLLTYYIMGKISRSQLEFKDTGFYEKNNIKLVSGIKAVSINRKDKKIVLENKEDISYHKLLIATGSSAKVQNISGQKEGAAYTLRVIEDADKIAEKLKTVDSAAVLGAGLIGMKIAHMLKEKGKKVFIIARSNQILSQMLDAESAGFLTGHIGKEATVLTGQDVSEILYSNSKMAGLRLLNNEKIDCGMVITAKGVTPNTELARAAGLVVDKGISVDETMKTSDNDIYAAGDVAESTDLLSGKKEIKALWTTAVEQGKIAARNMARLDSAEQAGQEIIYAGAVSMNSMECFSIPCISAGSMHGETTEVFDYRKPGQAVLRRIFVKDNRIFGFVTIGDIRFAGILNRLLCEKKDISSIKNVFNSAKLTRANLLECIGEQGIISSMEKQ